jgi:hypothetical protein
MAWLPVPITTVHHICRLPVQIATSFFSARLSQAVWYCCNKLPLCLTYVQLGEPYILWELTLMASLPFVTLCKMKVLLPGFAEVIRSALQVGHAYTLRI